MVDNRAKRNVSEILLRLEPPEPPQDGAATAVAADAVADAAAASATAATAAAAAAVAAAACKAAIPRAAGAGIPTLSALCCIALHRGLVACTHVRALSQLRCSIV